MQRFDAIIIGAGVIGCAIALFLARSGLKTLNVDALPAAGYGSTSSSAAVIRTYYSTLDGSALAFEGYHEWKHWEDLLQTEDRSALARFVETGALLMKTPGADNLKHILQHADTLQIPYELWQADRIKQALPGCNLESFAPVRTMDDDAFGEPSDTHVEEAVYFPASGYVDDPQIAARNLKEAAERSGATFRFNTKVERIAVTGNRVTGITCEDGSVVNGDIVVNVAGPHSAKVNTLLEKSAGVRIGTRPLRQEVVQLTPPEQFGYSREGLIICDNDVGCYVKPGGGGQMMIGSVNPPCDAHIEEDPDDFRRDLTDRALTYAYRFSQRLPALGVSQHPVGLADLYDASEDWLPIYDRSDVDGYYLAMGTSGNQFKNAVVAGRMVSELIAYCEAGNNHDLEPLQFPLRFVNHTINMATFSRKRQLTQASSFSVLG